jgi:hypothetical protein
MDSSIQLVEILKYSTGIESIIENWSLIIDYDYNQPGIIFFNVMVMSKSLVD